MTSSYVFGTHERSQKMHSCSCIPGRPRTKEACSRTGQPSSKSPSGPGYSNFQLRFWSMKSCLVSERLKATTRRCQRSELSLERLVATCPSRIRLCETLPLSNHRPFQNSLTKSYYLTFQVHSSDFSARYTSWHTHTTVQDHVVRRHRSFVDKGAVLVHTPIGACTRRARVRRLITGILEQESDDAVSWDGVSREVADRSAILGMCPEVLCIIVIE